MIPFPDKKYQIIYADPPWEYRLFSRDVIEGWDCWGNEVPTSEQKLLKLEQKSL